MILRLRRNKAGEPAAKKPNGSTNSSTKAPKKKKAVKETPAISDPPVPEDIINVLIGRFFTDRDNRTSNKEYQVVEQEESNDKACSSKRNREKPECKETEDREKDESKRLKKGKKTKAGKNICASVGNFDSASRPKQRAEDGFVATSIQEESETITANFGEQFLSAQEDPTPNKETPVLEQEEQNDKECSSKRKRERPEAKVTEDSEKDKSKRLKKGKKTKTGKNICRSDGNFSPSQLKQGAADGLLAASIEEEPETVTLDFQDMRGRGRSLVADESPQPNPDQQQQPNPDHHHQQQPPNPDQQQQPNPDQQQVALEPRVEGEKIIVEPNVMGTKLLDSGKVSRRLLKIFRSRWFVEGSAWKKLTGEHRKFYFDEFKKYFRWEACYTDDNIMDVFFKHAASRYADTISKMRTTGKKDPSVDEAVWAVWVQEWATDDAKQKSDTARSNRLSEPSGPGTGPSRHTGGSRSAILHQKALI